jgi:sec-independent protein translocase protein TatA
MMEFHYALISFRRISMGLGGMGHWVILALVVLVLFGRGRISEMMGDFGKGISSFKKGMSEGAEVKPEAPPAQIAAQPANEATLNGETVVDGSASKS